MQQRYSWFLLPLAVFLLLLLGPIVRHGMFLDGLVYTNIAQNLANGVGSIWQPLQFSRGAVFYEHPVLLPWVESLFFRLLGDGPHTEDWYNFTVLAATVACLYGIWGRVVHRAERWLFFFPLLLWLLNQEVQLRYPNTMLECGTTLVILLTVWGFLRLRQNAYGNMSAVVAGLGAVVAFFCKGPFGLFLLAIPVLHGLLVERRFTISDLLLPAGTAGVAVALLFILEPAACDFTFRYLNQQVFAALAGERVENIATTRFDFLFWLVALNLPGLILAGLVYVGGRSPELPARPDTHRYGWFFLAVGAAALLPLVISIKQATYYQLPALPFFVLGLSCSLLPRLKKVTDWVAARRPARLALLGIGLAGVVAGLIVTLSMIGTTDRRDREMLALVERIGAVFAEQEAAHYELVLGGDVASAANRSYRLTAFLARHEGVHKSAVVGEEYLLMIRHGGDQIPPGTRMLWEDQSVLVLQRAGPQVQGKD